MFKIKDFFIKVKFYLIDHYHILFKSAAVNHLRIQEVLKNPDGSYQLTLKFGSYSELKDYQKKLRRFTVSASSALAVTMVAFIVAPYVMNPSHSSASNFLWTQSSWVGAGTGAMKNYPADNNGVTDYTSKNNVDISSGKITLPIPIVASSGDSSYEGGDGFYRSDAGGNYSASGSLLALKKVQGASCSNTAECSGTSTCLSGTCCANACCGITSVTDPRDTNNSTYNTVALGNQCWMTRNLNVGTMIGMKLADGTTDQDQSNDGILEKFCYAYTQQGNSSQITTGNANCNFYGGLYQWAEANALAYSCNSNSCSLPSPNQGICPSGWHIPSDAEMKTLEMYFGMGSATADGTGWRSLSPNKFFTAVPNGFGTLSGSGYLDQYRAFGNNSGANSMFFTSTEYNATNYYNRMLNTNLSSVYRGYSLKKPTAVSVRCIKN